jgi:hypothetical protein
MLAHARQLLDSTGNVDVVLADPTELEFPPSSFDLAIVSLVLKPNHDARVEALIEKMRQWSRKTLLIEHVSGGAGGSEIAIVRSEAWYRPRVHPQEARIVERFKQAGDAMLFALFE